jgi:hypothetical protein
MNAEPAPLGQAFDIGSRPSHRFTPGIFGRPAQLRTEPAL